MTVEHKTFVVERELAASPKHAFRFFSEPALKERWTSCHPDWAVLEEEFDFRVGGVEAKRWRTDGGQEQTFLARYLDIVPARRIIYAFDMGFAGERLSASLATVEFFAEAARTRMVFTEQVAWLGDAGSMQLRIAGTGEGLDLLADIIAMEGADIH
ncbi:SRPBCC family protein [Mesorhizobium sp. NPDC059025]|uniref:SRPBCC family protein n=1 Tax=unclassified Mesorhizobium TaxID=325217 RepID=UPI00367DC7E9